MSFLTQLTWRYATKKFDATKKLSEEQFGKILEAIRMAPSSFGPQPYHMIVVNNPLLREKLKEVSFHQPQITDASHLIVFCARTDLLTRADEYFEVATGGDTEKRAAMKGYEDMMKGFLSAMPESAHLPWAARQAYIALGFGLAAAAELGVDSCPMEGFDGAQYKAILGVTENMQVLSVLTLGFRADDDSAAQRPKVRFPLSDLFETRD